MRKSLIINYRDTNKTTDFVGIQSFVAVDASKRADITLYFLSSAWETSKFCPCTDTLSEWRNEFHFPTHHKLVSSSWWWAL